MSRRNVLIGVQLALGLALAGLGHYYVSTLRSLYPVDGYLLWGIAGLLWARAWWELNRQPDAKWLALRDAIRTAFGVIGQALRFIVTALRDYLPQVSLRAVLLGSIGLNLLAALLALLLPVLGGLWLIVWVVSLVLMLGWAVTQTRWWHTRSIPRPMAQSVAPAPRALPEPIGEARRPRLLGLLAALLLLVAGQLAVGNVDQSGERALPLLSPVVDALHLDVIGDATVILAGLGLMATGVLVLALITRRAVLADAPRFVAEALPDRHRLDWRWMIVALAGLAVWYLAMQAVAGDTTGFGGVLPWLIGLGLIAASWWQVDRVRGVRWHIALTRTEALALGAALIGALIVLSFQLGEVPNTIWGDEGAYFTTARDIARGVFEADVFGLGTYRLPMAGSLVQAAGLSVLGENIAAWRFTSVLAVWASLLPLYFLVRSTLGQRAAWLALALMTISPYVLTYARLGYTAALSIGPVVATAALLWVAVRRDSRLYAYLAGGAAGASFWLHPSGRLALVLLIVWLAWMMLTRRVALRPALWHGAAATLGLVLVAAPAVVYGVARAPVDFASKQVDSAFNTVFFARDLYPEEQLFVSYGPFRVGEVDLFFEPALYVNLLVRGGLRTALSFHTPTLVRDNYLIGALAEPFGLLYLIGLGWCLGQLRRPGFALWPMWLIAGSFTLSAMSAFPPRPALMLPVTPALAALSAIGLVAVVDLLAQLAGGVPARVKAGGLIGLALVLAFMGLRQYFFEMPQRFPTDLDNAVFWRAQAMPAGSDVTVILPDSGPDDYVPWGLREFKSPVNFHVIKTAALPFVDWPSLCPNACAFFYGATEAGAAWPALQQAFGGEPEPYLAGGQPQFYRFEP